MKTHKRRQAWERDILQDAEKYGSLGEISGERNMTHTHFSYMELLCDIINAESSIYEEAIEKKERKDAMIEEYL